MNPIVILPLLLLAPVAHGAPPEPLAHTYSIVARDPATGEMGVAVQSHYFSVGPVVPWAEAGVGAVATQSLVLVDYGPNGLDLMRAGMTARQALDSLVRADAHNEGRQVAMLDARGNVAAHTGSACIPAAGHRVGENYSVQANLMANDRVWPAMATAFERATGDLAERMMQALEAAEQAGGDIRGRQSAAMLVVEAADTGRPWPSGDVVVDLRVEDHPEPLVELERLLGLQRAFAHAEEFDRRIEAGDTAGAWEEISAAERLAPGNVELQFWKAVTLAEQGREAAAREILVGVYRGDPNWAELLRRLPGVGLGPSDPGLIARLAAPAD